MGASIWRMVLSGFTISAWYFKWHFQENYCKAISPALIIFLAWECSWFDLAVLTYGEAMKPTFGKRAAMEPLPIVKPIEYEEWLQGYLNAPVSYTHLTLPTIYSV